MSSSNSKYIPHQSVKESRRRLRQIRNQTLKGSESFIPYQTRLSALGLY